jgi:hypothetical protein
MPRFSFTDPVALGEDNNRLVSASRFHGFGSHSTSLNVDESSRTARAVYRIPNFVRYSPPGPFVQRRETVILGGDAIPERVAIFQDTAFAVYRIWEANSHHLPLRVPKSACLRRRKPMARPLITSVSHRNTSPYMREYLCQRSAERPAQRQGTWRKVGGNNGGSNFTGRKRSG